MALLPVKSLRKVRAAKVKDNDPVTSAGKSRAVVVIQDECAMIESGDFCCLGLEVGKERKKFHGGIGMEEVFEEAPGHRQ